MEDALSSTLRNIRRWEMRLQHFKSRIVGPMRAGNPSSATVVTVVCCVFFALLWAITIGNAFSERTRTLVRADQMLTALADTYASYATAIANLYQHSADRYPPLASPIERARLAEFRHTFRLPSGMRMHILDGRGRLVAGDSVAREPHDTGLLTRSRAIVGTAMTAEVDYSEPDLLRGWRSANLDRGALLAGASLTLLILATFARGIARKRDVAIRRWRALFQDDLDCHYVLKVDLSLRADEWPIIEANASGRELLAKISRSSSLARSGSCVPVWARARVATEDALCVAEGTSRTYIVVSPDRAQAYAVTAVPVQDSDRGPISQLIVRVRDISERERHEAELESAIYEAEAASRAKSAILANTSHELRTPLNAIIGYSEMMQTGIGGPLTEKQMDYLQIIHRSGRHLLDIISDILDLAKIESGRFDLHEEEISMRTLVEDCVELLEPRAREKGLELTVGTIAVPPLRADATRIRQVLMNLLSNAVKFTEHGSVSVGVTRTDTGGMCIRVADTGVGMTPEEIKLAGEPFRQGESGKARHQEGTGLGLSLSKKLALLHGGTFTVKSTKGVGTSVIVSFGPERVCEPSATRRAS